MIEDLDDSGGSAEAGGAQVHLPGERRVGRIQGRAGREHRRKGGDGGGWRRTGGDGSRIARIAEIVERRVGEGRIGGRRPRVDMLEGEDADLRVELGDPSDRRRAPRRIGQRARVLSRRGVSRHGPDAVDRSAVRDDLGPAVVQIGIVEHPRHVQLHYIAGFRRRVDRRAGPFRDVSGVVRVVAVAVAEENRFRTHVHEILGQDRGAALVQGRGGQLRTIDVAVEQDDASQNRCDVRGIRRPGEDDFVLVHSPLVIDVLDPEKFLPRLDQRGTRFPLMPRLPVVSVFPVLFGDGGQTKNRQDARQNHGHHSSAVHDMSSSLVNR